MIAIVCGLSEVERLVAVRSPSHVITLLDPATTIQTPRGVAPERHLRLGLNDINEPMEGLVMAEAADVAQLLEFGRTWDEASPILIHCWAGISRSTASAFVLACERSPAVDERRIALAMRRIAPHALPNRRIVALADEMLSRRGRMVDALQAMGDYDHTLAGPFDFPVRHR
jgi:predicted protein tyrosine phosphatase